MAARMVERNFISSSRALASGEPSADEKNHFSLGSNDGITNFCHFTPKEIMRMASGKKIIIKAKHTTRAHIVIHFILLISNFMCMK